ncbi:hypothetical protein GGD65_005119 [Bradyrhizobium sp. CIR18]|nr:hypothetical protein [Bradyrhizobium sp. CIR18]
MRERRFKRTAKSRGPGCRCYSQALRRCAEPDRAKRAAIREVTEASRNSSPGRARHRPSNIAQGRPDVSASPVHPLCIACASHRTTDPRVPVGARPSLRPFVEGAMRSAKLGRKRREEVKACLQHTTGVVGGQSDLSAIARRATAEATHASRAAFEFGGHGAVRLCLPYGTVSAAYTRCHRPRRRIRDPRGCSRAVPTNVARSHRFDKKSPVDGPPQYLDESTPVGP